MTQQTKKRLLGMGLTLVPALVLGLLLGSARAARAAGTVGSGTGTCNDAGLNTAMAGGGLVLFNCGPGPVTLSITLKTLVSGTTTLDGGAGQITLDGQNGNQLFVVTGTATLNIKNLTLARGFTNVGNGGAIYNHGVLSITNSTLADSHSTSGLGGGLYNDTGLVALDHVTFRGNSAGSGAGLYNYQGTLTIANSTFVTNTGTGGLFSGIGGGGFYNSNGSTTTVTNTTFLSNTSSYDGGAVLNRGALSVTNSSLTGNLAWYGGGIENQSPGANLYLVDTTLRANQAYTTYFGGQGNGGGLDNYVGTAVLSGVTLDANFAASGGGLENDTGTLTLTASTLSYNSAGYGGGLQTAHGASALTNVTLSGNSATVLGGGYENYHGRGTLTNVTLSGNTAPSAGGIYQLGTLASQIITLTDTLVAHGVAGQDCLSPSATFSITSNNYNLADDTSCNAYFLKPNDQKNVNPLLGVLANNGGLTLTHLPAANSPAVDQGGLVCPATDQRDISRPQNGLCDIGAVERATSFVPTNWLYLPLVRK